MSILFRRMSLVLLVSMVCGAFAREIHVAKTGNDGAAGSASAPYLTVGKAAAVAQAGDTITIHGGVYREYVAPPQVATRSRRIVFRAATGENATISGAERITTWVSQGGGVWKVDLPASFFGSNNPFTLNVSGDYQDYGKDKHRGDVFLNDEVYYEKMTLANVQSTTRSWYTTTANNVATIYANFGSADPNTENSEIAVRECVIFPSGNNAAHYLTFSGLRLEKAATNWVPPSSSQKGVIGSNGGHHWIIENCIVRFGKTVGIALGGPSLRDTAQIGHHLIRNNVIQYCGEAGICGCWGTGFSIIENNFVEYTNFKNEIGGAETSALKFHFSVDLIIRGNIIRGCRLAPGAGNAHGIWLDCANTNTLIFGNCISETDKPPLYFEKVYGPTLVANNVLCYAGGSTMDQADASYFVHNLFYNFQSRPNDGYQSTNGAFLPHSYTNAPNVPLVSGSNFRYYNNLVIRGGIVPNKTYPNFISDYNAFYNGAGRYQSSDQHSVSSSTVTGFGLSWSSGAVTISFTLDSAFQKLQCPLITSGLLGTAPVPGMEAEYQDASKITIGFDIYGKPRNMTHPTVGPFEDLKPGLNTFVLTTNTTSITPVERNTHSCGQTPFLRHLSMHGPNTLAVINDRPSTLSIINAAGRMVRSIAIGSDRYTTFDFSTLSPGYYHARLVTSGAPDETLPFTRK